jgi:hypothetical protein
LFEEFVIKGQIRLLYGKMVPVWFFGQHDGLGFRQVPPSALLGDDPLEVMGAEGVKRKGVSHAAGRPSGK